MKQDSIKSHAANEVVEVVLVKPLTLELDAGGGLGLLLAELVKQVDQLLFAHLALQEPSLRVLNQDHLEALGLLGLDDRDVGETLLGLVGENLLHDGLPLLLHLLLLLHFHLRALDRLLLSFHYCLFIFLKVPLSPIKEPS